MVAPTVEFRIVKCLFLFQAGALLGVQLRHTIRVNENKMKRGAMSESVNTAKLLEALHSVVRDAEALLQATSTQTGERIDAVRSRAEESLQQAKSSLSDLQDEAVQGVRDAAAATHDYIKKNPWQSLGLAAGLGLLVGLLLRRRD